ncbi:GlsB/YeaQ/YmgE family stress response membrane protein [Mucilaginibacter sp. FT3.2]|uniref:GlsB/YeaQ/YmgE family stress response membrane protein n=1 Tax=Mucilaginibacter sp. FT3.2 TaxID=2723090 RepID=UPI00161E2125|nr:GlsB/YeaQ/YmgE family stress response membrane protein [Mucilaginibacter sp. FT3.2]MBB6234171.1 putative membrane protein YeaQ/YmgE (transglycosylase-associated protein family) [Mucilaginibacter sp. FT3.2]
MIFHLILGGLAALLAGRVMRGDGYGVVVDVLLGLVGGWVGSWVLGLLRFDVPAWSYFITAFLGAILIVWLVRVIKGD